MAKVYVVEGGNWQRRRVTEGRANQQEQGTVVLGELTKIAYREARVQRDLGRAAEPTACRQLSRPAIAQPCACPGQPPFDVHRTALRRRSVTWLQRSPSASSCPSKRFSGTYRRHDRVPSWQHAVVTSCFSWSNRNTSNFSPATAGRKTL